ncbi:MAG: phosphoribosyltransferase [Peptococcaceae bacterium]|nr:phosphoribosyltransferase [Peptococcaceae bacterium]
MFKDRNDAGRQLAGELSRYTYTNGLVLGIPRGGVVVAAAVADRLKLPLDVIVPRKIGVPGNPETAIGAVTEDGTAIYDDHLMHLLHLEKEDLQPHVAEVIAEIKRRTVLYRGERRIPNWQGHAIILVDDGIATGYTTLAALRSIKKHRPQEIILAVPVAPPDTLAKLEPEVDRVVCLETPQHFYAVGQFYRDFDQTTDEEVIDLLRTYA